MEKEIWKDVVGFEGHYQVSNLGRIKTICYKGVPCDKLRKISKDNRVALRKENKSFYFKIDLLVAQVFLQKSLVMECVNHLNGDENDNRAINLEWDLRTFEQKRIDTYTKNAMQGTPSWTINGNSVYFEISNSKEYGICDLEEWERFKDYKWRLSKRGYLDAHIKGKTVLMHKILLPTKEGYIVDHINRNKLDNRKSNLRYATKKVNAINRSISSKNTSGCIGVSIKKNGKYVAHIGCGKKISLGTYSSFEQAKKARQEAEDKYFKPIIEKETHI